MSLFVSAVVWALSSHCLKAESCEMRTQASFDQFWNMYIHQHSKESSWQYVLCHLNFTCSPASKTKEDGGRKGPSRTPLNWCRCYGDKMVPIFVPISFLLSIYVYIFTGNISMCVSSYLVPGWVEQGLRHQTAIRPSKRFWQMHGLEFISDECRG